MRIPYVRGGIARVRGAVAQAPATLRGFSGIRLQQHIARGAFAEREVLAWRPFGFGSRMGELLNARRVATALGARFVFHWPRQPLYDVEEAAAVFDPDFVAEHHVPVLDIKQFGRLATTIRPSDLRDLATGHHRGARMAERYEIDLAVRGLVLPSFREAFDSVRFAGPLEAIRSSVAAVPSIAIAVHVRRWDVAVPTSRFGGVFSPKQMPVALIERVVDECRREGAGEVLLLGNNPAFIADLAQSLGAHTAEELLPIQERSPQAAAFRDFCLLTQAETVLGGTSAFARVAQLVAGSRVVLPERTIAARETHRLLWRSAMAPSPRWPLEATLASDHLFQRPDLVLSAEDEILLLERTVELDPEDPTRWLGLLVRLARSGSADRAAEVMAGMAAQFDGREGIAVESAYRSRTRLAQPAHLTDADWQELRGLEVLGPAWLQAVRAAG